MNSNNILLLGILFVALLITLCTTRLLDQLNPTIKTVPTPHFQIIEQSVMDKDK
jgi:hypothetical protein